MSKLDTNHVVNLDLVKDRVNSVIKFGLADVETSDFFVGLYNNGSRVFDKDYIVTLYIVKPNGTFRNIKLEPKEGLKKYYCNLPDTLKNIPGEYVCQVMVFDNLTGEKKISKSKFKYSVSVDLASEMAGIIDEEEQESILTNILNRLLTLENPVEPYATQKHVDECVSTLTEEIETINVKDTEQDGKLSNIETKNIEQDNRLTNIETKDIEQDGRLNSLENRVGNIDEKIVNTIEPSLDNYGNRLDALETKDIEHEQRMTNIETKNTEQDNRLTSIEGINATQNNRLDTLEAKDIVHESRMTDIETKNTEHDNRLNSLESKDLSHESRLTNIESKNAEQDEKLNNVESKNVEQDSRLDITENRLANIGNDITNTMQPIIDAHTSRLDAIEAIDVAQNNRLDAIEVKNQQQEDRLLDIEKVNNRQDIDIKCLYGASQTIDITKEGNSIYLQNSNNGFVAIDEIQGNTMVNCNKEPDKEIILNGNINTQGYSNVTITEGVDGGLVDVALEGNTLVNVSKTKDSAAIFKAYTVENSGNHIALQGDVDGNCRPVITGNTLWIDNDTEEILTAFGENRNLRLQSTFEDNLVTQEMVDSGEEVADNLGKYKVEYKVVGKNKFDGKLELGNINNNTGTLSPSSNSVRSVNFIPVMSGSVITVSNDMNYCNYIYEYDNNYNFIKYTGASTEKDSKTITLDNNTKFIKFRSISGDEENNLDVKYQVEYSEEATSYEPYKEYTKTLYLNSPLLEGDTIEEKDNGIYHVHRSELLAYTEGDETSLITDKVNTLHRLDSPTYELIEQSNLAIPSYANGHLDLTSAVPVEKVEFLHFEEELTYLYENTQYTVQFVSDATITVNITLGGTQLLAQNIVVGLNKITITTPAALVDNKLVIDGAGANISEVVVTDTNREFGYFEGMKSVGECEDLEVVSRNKNLWDMSKVKHQNEVQYNYTIENNIITYTIGGGGIYIEFKAKAGDILRINGTLSNINNVRLFYKRDEFVGGGVYNNSINGVDYTINQIITIPENSVYQLRLWTNNSSIPVTLTDFIVTLNVADVVYMKAKSTTQTLQHEPLRGVGDIKDRYVLIDGKWYIERNCGGYTFTGNEKWRTDASSENIQAFIANAVPNIKSSSTNIISNIYPKKKSKWSTKEVGFDTGSNNALMIYVLKSDASTVEELRNYLSKNEVSITYELQTPQYEPIDYNPFEVYSEVTHISNNSTIPCNMTIKNTGYNCLLKPSTTYTVSSNLGLNTVTTPSTLTEDCLRFMDTDTSDVTTMKNVMVLEGDYTTGKPMPSHFAGIESAFEQEYDEAIGKYKVKVRVQNEDASKENYIEFYIDEPLRGIGDVKDKVYVKDDKVVVERNCGIRAYEDGDFGTYLTDKVNTVYPLEVPTYEEVGYNDTKLFIESFKNSTLFYNGNVPVTSTVHYSYSVPIVDTVQQTASISDEQDSMIIDLATQCAVMEIMLM